MTENSVGVLGASSLVGKFLLAQLSIQNKQILAFSRQFEKIVDAKGATQELVCLAASAKEWPEFDCLISVAPIWVLPEYFKQLNKSKIRRIVVLSSTSVISKINSQDIKEQQTVNLLKEGEEKLKNWAEENSIEWFILRPTLIYGLGEDKNISETARLIDRFGFFPLLGQAKGLRQPIHAEDIAEVCVCALSVMHKANRIYNLSGGETLSYREMISRVFIAKGKVPHFLPIPLVFFKWLVWCLNLLPKYRHWTVSMAERMNQDLVFDHTDATQDLDFTPRKFCLTKKDIL